MTLIEPGTMLVAVDVAAFFGVERYKNFRRGSDDPIMAEYCAMKNVRKLASYERNQFKAPLPKETSFLAPYRGYGNVSTQYQRVWVRLHEKDGHPPVYEVTKASPEYSAAQLRG